MANGGHQGNPQVIMPYHAPVDSCPLPGWKYELNTIP
jgi:hypothetical protein